MNSRTVALSILIVAPLVAHAHARAHEQILYPSPRIGLTDVAYKASTSEHLKNGGGAYTYNPALYAKGTTYTVVDKYIVNGKTSYAEETNYKVIGLATFRGHKLIDIRKHLFAYPSHKAQAIVDNFYRIGANFVYLYGNHTQRGTEEEYNVPPISIPKRYILNVPYAEKNAMHTIVGGADTILTFKRTATYLGTESITVPAGTFETYKLKTKTSQRSGQLITGKSYTWIVASGTYAGLVVKQTFVRPASGSTAAYKSTRVALSLRLNGVATTGGKVATPVLGRSVKSGAGRISFYGDIGNIISSQNPLLVHPSTLRLAEDGSVALLHLQWSGWGTRVARASGVWSASSCTPSCAAGKLTTSPARLTLSSPGIVDGHRVYRCFDISPPHPKRDAWPARECIHRQGTLHLYASVSHR